MGKKGWWGNIKEWKRESDENLKYRPTDRVNTVITSISSKSATALQKEKLRMCD